MSRRQELLDADEAAWEEFHARFHRIGEEGWLKPGACGDWTPKDLMAHIACWHAETASIIEQVRAGGTFPQVDVEAFNVDFYERCRDMALKDVQAMSGAAHSRFREEVAHVPAELFTERMEAWVAGNGHGHYDEHIPLFDAFLEAV